MSKNYLNQRNNHFANLVKKNIIIPNLVENGIKKENKISLRYDNTLFKDKRNNLNCLYMLQTKSDIPELLSFIKNRDYILLSYKENTPNTTIFYPNSTWTSGRNKIREHVLKLEKKYDYYIFLDEDIKFKEYNQEDGFNYFEKLLGIYQPKIATPNYYNNQTDLYYLSNVSSTIWHDPMYIAYNFDEFNCNKIFPYTEIFDSRSWPISQYIMTILCSNYKKQIVVFNNLKIKNEIHSKYPTQPIEKEVEEYVYDNILKKEIDILNKKDFIDLLPVNRKDFIDILPVNNKCIVITTINQPSAQILYYSKLKNWDLIIVGNSDTNDLLYKNLNCIYLDLNDQKRLFPTVYDKIPLKSYNRKMFGYLYAIKNKYTVIYDTIEDNQYSKNLDDFLQNDNSRSLKCCSSNGFVNLYKNYTNQNIWPRGIPPEHTSVNHTCELNEDIPNLKVSIIQGLVNNNPDVDAFYRININYNDNYKSFIFENNNEFDVILNKNSICPFNAQNTFWIDSDMFYTLYLPITVSPRYTDILRGFIALYQLWKNNKTIKFTHPNSIQELIEHDLQTDYEHEIIMYQTVENVINILNKNKNASIQDVYKILVNYGIVKNVELELLDEWMKFF